MLNILTKMWLYAITSIILGFVFLGLAVAAYQSPVAAAWSAVFLVTLFSALYQAHK
jgi:hypothetical protein